MPELGFEPRASGANTYPLSTSPCYLDTNVRSWIIISALYRICVAFSWLIVAQGGRMARACQENAYCSFRSFTECPFPEIYDNDQIAILGTYHVYCTLSPQMCFIILKGQYNCVLHLLIKWNLKKLNNLIKIIWLVNERGRIWTWVCLSPEAILLAPDHTAIAHSLPKTAKFALKTS